MPETAPALGRREATLRCAATVSLAGIAVLEAVELPFAFAAGSQYGALSLVVMAACLGLGLALAAAPASTSRQLWSVVAAAAIVLLAGWLAPRIVTIPGLEQHQGHWALTRGAACSALAVVCLVLAAVAVPPARWSLRALATALAVLVAFAPGLGMLFVALGPGLLGGEKVLASGVHVHSHGSPDSTIVFQALPGGKGGHFVYKATPVPHQSAFGIALIVAAAFVFIYGAVIVLRRRSAPGGPLRLDRLEGEPA